MNIDQPKPDPAIESEKAAARAEKIDTIRSRLGSQTDQLIRSYGARQALFGGSTRPPILGF